MTDLATLLTQLYQHAHSMENIFKAIYIPENITQSGHAHCKEYLDMVLDHMIKVRDTFCSILEHYPQDLNTRDVQIASTKQDRLAAQFRTLTTALWERTPARPTVNPSASAQSVTEDTSTTDTERLREATTQTNAKYVQLRHDLGQLTTSVMARKWTHPEDHIITLGMKSHSTWRNQHASISKQLIEVENLAKLHNLTDLQDCIADTRSETMDLYNRLSITILEIEAANRTSKACPTQPPPGNMSGGFDALTNITTHTAVPSPLSLSSPP